MSQINKDHYKNSRARIAIIDADSALYATALSAEAISVGTGDHGEDEYLQMKDGEQCYNEVCQKLEKLVEDVGAEDAIICLTATKSSFRYHLLPSYKGNRATMRRPAFLKELQYAVMTRKPFRTLAVRGLEADDICGISQGTLQEANLREPIIVSIDKDMLQIPGLSYSWISKDKATGELIGIRDTSEAEGDRMFLYQTLTGDTVDNYTGCPGIGPKKAAHILEQCAHNSMATQWEFVFEAFKKKGLSLDYALTQARVARILRSRDWNSTTHEVTLWVPPSLTETECATATPMPRTLKAASTTEAGTLPVCIGPVVLNLKTLLHEKAAATHH